VNLISRKNVISLQKALLAQNMPSTICIQTRWYIEMMLTHGHEKGVTINATFNNNKNKVHPLSSMQF
jgi:hypothetical protein